jgi:hypothetical protein
MPRCLEEEEHNPTHHPARHRIQREAGAPQVGCGEDSIVVFDTEETVRELWPEITAVAGLLMERGWLEADEVMRIIERTREQRERGG